MANTYGKKLGKLDSSWKKTKSEFGDSTGGFETVPTANYVIGKLHCELGEDPNGYLRIERKQTILEGEHADFIVKDNMNLDPAIAPRGQEFALKWLNLLGYTVDSLADDLEETLDAINENEDATYKATIKEKDGWNNVFYNGVLDEGSGAAEPDDGVEDGGEDKESNNSVSGRGEMPDIDELKTRQLKKLIKEEKLDVSVEDDADDDDLRDAIEAAWDKPPVGATEEKSTGRTSRRAAKSDNKDDDEKMRVGLYTLADAFGISVDADDTLPALKKTLGDFTFKKKELEAKEIKLLEDTGLEKIIK